MTTESLVTLWVTIASTFTINSKKTSNALIKRSKTTPDLLTRILPELGKCVHRSLSIGFIEVPKGLFLIKKGWTTPAFLHEYFSLIYDQDGVLRELADTKHITELLTLLFLFYKYEQPFTTEQVEKAVDEFIETDQNVKTDLEGCINLERVKNIFMSLLPDDPFDIVMHNSNGATADHVNNVMKDHMTRYIPKLHKVYNLSYYFNTKEHAMQARVDNQLVKSNPTSKLALVPKDSRGPRKICMEPHEIMKGQKGLQDKLYTHIESPGNPAYKYINFTDQKINQHLAYLGSLDGSLVTIDMKDASDMVSWAIISHLVTPDWFEALNALRSECVSLPDGRVIALNKFAPMGSALCFPIEAMLFYSICRSITDKVWVYGDDIIVSKVVAYDVIAALESYGLVINRDKSLINGLFRESCGGDYFKGANITPLRIKKLDLVSIVSLANNFADKFSRTTGRKMIEWYESLNQTVILRLHHSNRTLVNNVHIEHCPLIAFYDDFDNTVLFPRKWNKDLQRYEISSLTVVTRLQKTHKSTNEDCKLLPSGKKLVPPTYVSHSSEYNEFNAWLTRTQLHPAPKERELIQELLTSVVPYQNYTTSFEGSTYSRTRLTAPKVQFRWAGYIERYPVTN